MKNIFYLLLFCCIPVLGQNDVLFETGNEAYNEGDYSEALENYEQILESGETSAELYFNLANTHYKLNNVGPGIYYYEKALQLKPGDKDIKANLAIAQQMAVDDIQVDPETGISAIINRAGAILSFNGWAWTAVFFMAVFAGLFLLYYFSSGSGRKRLFFTTASVAFVFSVVALLFAFQQHNLMTNVQQAVIFDEEIQVRSEPNTRSEQIFNLHEGTKFKVVETYDEWIKLELPNGLQGWTKGQGIRLL